MVVPKDIEASFSKTFGFPKVPLMGQVATSTSKGPEIRTMRLYDIRSTGELVFLSHRISYKWQQLEQDPHLAICFLSSDLLTQVTLQGKATLTTELPEREEYWEKMRPDVRKVYCDDNVNSNPPSTFGVILVDPFKWELLELAPNDYPASHRVIYEGDKGKWLEKKVEMVP